MAMSGIALESHLNADRPREGAYCALVEPKLKHLVHAIEDPWRSVFAHTVVLTVLTVFIVSSRSNHVVLRFGNDVPNRVIPLVSNKLESVVSEGRDQ